MAMHTTVTTGLRINPKKTFFINIFQNPLSECGFLSTHSINTEKTRRISFFSKKTIYKHNFVGYNQIQKIFFKRNEILPPKSVYISRNIIHKDFEALQTDHLSERVTDHEVTNGRDV
ncbi:MAG: hypothetical protein IJW99_10385 [Clostridia bacterium]|nr:hypothetical protein [Clostridia bacterium]